METSKIKDKFIKDLNEILTGCEFEFNPTLNHLNQIHKLSKNLSCKGFNENKKISHLKLLIWKYYRIYKLKEFILLFHKRIATEMSTVEKNSFKTVEMINAVFCWEITNSGNNNDKKYNQKYYSDRVLQQKVNKNYLNQNNSITDKTLLLKAVLGEDLIEYEGFLFEPEIRRSSKTNNQWNELVKSKFDDKWNEKYIGENGRIIEEISLKEILCKNLNDIYSGQNFIHSFATISSGKIQLDHVLPRFYVKKIIEELCVKLKTLKKRKDQIELIDWQINFLFPLMFGCVVTREENIELNQISVEQANICYAELDIKKQNSLIESFKAEFKGEIEDFRQLFQDKEKGKKARKWIASELFFQYWNNIQWDDEQSKNDNRKNILNLLFSNYTSVDLVEINGDNSNNIKLWEVTKNGLEEVIGFQIENDNIENEISMLENTFNC